MSYFEDLKGPRVKAMFWSVASAGWMFGVLNFDRVSFVTVGSKKWLEGAIVMAPMLYTLIMYWTYTFSISPIKRKKRLMEEISSGKEVLSDLGEKEIEEIIFAGNENEENASTLKHKKSIIRKNWVIDFNTAENWEKKVEEAAAVGIELKKFNNGRLRSITTTSRGRLSPAVGTQKSTTMPYYEIIPKPSLRNYSLGVIDYLLPFIIPIIIVALYFLFPSWSLPADVQPECVNICPPVTNERISSSKDPLRL